jgi:hypothetical protein
LGAIPFGLVVTFPMPATDLVERGNSIVGVRTGGDVTDGT